MRKTQALAQVLWALMDDPTGRHWGYELSKRAGVRSGVLYPILHRMLDDGWLEDGWENPRHIPERRPPRRYYELTPNGRAVVSELIQEMRGEPYLTSRDRSPLESDRMAGSPAGGWC